MIWLDQNASTPPEAESQQPEARVTEPQSQQAVTPTDPEQTTTVEQEIPEAPENFYTFYELLISGEVPIDIDAGQTRDEAVAKRSKAQLFRLLHLGQLEKLMTLASPYCF